MGESLASVGLDGLQNSSVPATTDVVGNVASVAGNALAGAGAGALSGAAIGAAGGPIGALGGAAIGGGISLITSGLNAWLGNRQARAERDKANALAAENRKIAAQDRADLERWRQTYHLDTIAAAKEDRRRHNMESARNQMAKTAENMQTILATSQNAKAAWAKFGF
jgi:phage tail tape-measure protein